MRASASTIFLLSILLSLWPRSTFAIKRSYVVYMGAHSHPADVSSVDYDRVTDSHHVFLGSFLGSKEKAKEAIFHSYTRYINGFAATLEDAEAAEISNDPKVVSVFLNRGRELQTTRSWEFMRLEDNGKIRPRSIWKKARFGEDTIIGNLDSGVWPESKSFIDEELGPIPLKWKGICQTGSDAAFQCNRYTRLTDNEELHSLPRSVNFSGIDAHWKLIGARYFNKGYAAAMGPLNSSFDSPRDTSGHGTHTLSIAGGNFVAGANLFGFGNGTAKGGSPKARVAAYKVCWPGADQCYDADILAAFDMAIHDGVDVLSISLQGYYPSFFSDSVSVGSFHAVKHGIVVVCAAGNYGPDAGSVSNTAPWQITVGASTMDRQFPSYVVLGNKLRLRGESLSSEALPRNKFFPIITATEAKAANASSEDALLCKVGTLDPCKVKGKILVCQRGDTWRVDKGQQAALAGAVGMVLANDKASGNEIIADPHVLPASHINYADGLAIFSYINNTMSPRAYITRPTTQVGTKPAPLVAAFSSRGPNYITPEILKPDIIAPGVSVVAAYTEAEGPTNADFDKRRAPFNIASGTSMSCPHVSGIVGLLKTLHPGWSPAAIQSAIMTTARTRDNTVKPMTNASDVKATPFDYGAGHVNPHRAMDPGLIYDLTANDYMSFVCSLGYNSSQIMLFTKGPYKCPNPISLINFNYPSITVPNLKGSTTVTRTVKNVGSPATYTARIVNPAGVAVDIEPKTLEFGRIGEEKSYRLTLKLTKSTAARDYVFGRLTWSNGKHHVRSPIVVKAS